MGLSFKGIANSIVPIATGGLIGGAIGGGPGSLVGGVLGGASSLGMQNPLSIHPQLSLINKTGYNPEVMANQNALIEMMKRRAQGQDSLAAAQAQATGQQNINQALALAASARGVNPNMAFRSAQLQAGDVGAQTAQNAMLGRLAEMQQAGQLYGNAIGQQAQYTSELDKLRAQQEMAQLQAATQTQTAQYGANTGILSGLAGGAGAGITKLALSDKNAKKNISYDPKEVEKMFSKMKPATFEYKDEENGKGKYAGVMAQDMEKTKAGKDMVVETKKGKQIDMHKMMMAMMAQMTNMSKQLESLKA